MKNHKLKLLNVAVLACFGVAAQQAGAAVDISSGGTNTPIKVANEKTSALTIAANKITVDAFSGLNTKVAPLTVRFDLIGGLKFATAPKLGCDKNGSAASSGAVSAIVGGSNNSNVTFQVASGILSAVPTCTLSATYKTTGSLANKSVSATLSYAVGGVTTSHSRSGAFITFTKAMATKFTPGGTVKVDATKNAQKFVSANSASLLTASLGRVQFSASTVIKSAAGGNVSASLTLSTANITVSGPSLAAGFTAVSGQVYLVPTAQSCVAGSPVTTYSSKSGTSVTFNSVPLLDLNKGFKVCMSVNGKTTIPTGAITATVTAVPLTNYAVDTTATSNALTTVASNGGTMNAYFINASNSTSKTSVIRIINTAGYDSTVLTGTAYAEDGTVLGTAGASLGTVKKNGMLTLTSADIESKLGITGLTPTAKYRLVISSDMTSFKVINFSKDVASGSVNIAQQQTD